MIDLSAIEGWVFDLDDTLFPEREYVKSGFAAVGDWLSEAARIPRFNEVALKYFEMGVRGRIFDKTLEELGVVPERELIDELVDRYRKHCPDIILDAATGELLSRLSNKRVAIISDGPFESQNNKIKALGLTAWACPIVLTDSWGRNFWKPHPRAFQHVEQLWSLSGRSLVYVADNPAKDFAAPTMLGWRTIRMRLDGGEHEMEPDITAVDLNISGPTELLHLIAQTRS